MNPHLKKNYSWSNWAKNQSCIAENYFEPKTEAEIVDIIQLSGKKKFAWLAQGIHFHLSL
jgi:L-gulonolactone oxidase